MNKKLKKMIATVSAVAMCATSVVSMSTGALFFTDMTGRIYEECTDFGYPNILRTAIDDNSYAYCNKKATRHDLTTFSTVFLYFEYYSELSEEKANELSEFLSENYPSILYECTDNGETFGISLDYQEELSEDEKIKIATDIYQNINLKCGGIMLADIITAKEFKMLLPKPTLTGDANEDGEVNSADAVYIMQSLSNPDEYQLTPQGLANADMDGDGVTALDALRIQEMMLNK